MSNQFPYDETTRDRMLEFADRLSEVDLRAYAAVEAYKLGRGGVSMIASLFAMSPETIKRGQRDLDDPSRLAGPGRQRHQGGGRRGVLEEQPGLKEAFETLLESHRAGDPMNEDVKWTDLLPDQIATRLHEQGFEISGNTVRALLANASSRRGSQQRC